MHRALPTWLCLGASLLLAACGGDGAAPGPHPGIPLELALEAAPGSTRPLEVAAVVVPTASRAGRHAWALDVLFGAAATKPGARLAVFHGEGDEPHMLRPADQPTGRAWFLVLEPDGSHALVLATRDAPLADGAAAAERLAGVTRLRLLLGRAPAREPLDEQAVRARIAELLHVSIDGTTRAVTREELAGVRGVTVPGEREGKLRLAWPVRELVRVLGGDGARLAGVLAVDGRTLRIPEAQWMDEARVPWLRLNRRGSLKYYWADREGRLLRGGALREVSGLQLVAR